MNSQKQSRNKSRKEMSQYQRAQKKSRKRKVYIRGFKYVMSAPNAVATPYVQNVSKHSVRIAGVKFITKAHASDIVKEVYNLLNFTRHTLGAKPA